MTRRVEITITVRGVFRRFIRAAMTPEQQRAWIGKYAATPGAVIEVRHVG